MSAPAGYPVPDRCECEWIGHTLASACEAHKAWLRGVVSSERAAEREACAKIAEDYYRKSTFSSRVRSLGQYAADGIAAAIRNRVR